MILVIHSHTLAYTQKLFTEPGRDILEALVKKTARLPLRLEPDTMEILKQIAGRTERSVAAQALYYIKQGIERELPRSHSATPSHKPKT